MFAFCGGGKTSRVNQCFMTRDQSARCDLPTFGAILIKSQLYRPAYWARKINLGTKEGTGDLVGVLVVVLI